MREKHKVAKKKQPTNYQNSAKKGRILIDQKYQKLS